jgi:aspartyl protease family protein
MRRNVFLAFLLIFSAGSDADVYTWTDSFGRLHFSDIPVPGASKYQVKDVNRIHNPTYNLEADRKRKEIPYQMVKGNMMVRGKVNGVPLRFVVDTGASHVVIPPTVAKRADIRSQGAREVVMDTANGKARAVAVWLDRLDIDSMSEKNVRAVIQKLSGKEEKGLLGMNFLGRYKMTIDHQHHLLILERR